MGNDRRYNRWYWLLKIYLAVSLYILGFLYILQETGLYELPQNGKSFVLIAFGIGFTISVYKSIEEAITGRLSYKRKKKEREKEITK